MFNGLALAHRKGKAYKNKVYFSVLNSLINVYKGQQKIPQSVVQINLVVKCSKIKNKYNC